jgi:hypothetical protein
MGNSGWGGTEPEPPDPPAREHGKSPFLIALHRAGRPMLWVAGTDGGGHVHPVASGPLEAQSCC